MTRLVVISVIAVLIAGAILVLAVMDQFRTRRRQEQEQDEW
jgi:hypothetical protein